MHFCLSTPLGPMLRKEKETHYYVEGHDHSDVLVHCKKYLEEEGGLKLRQYLWVQLTLAKALELDEQGKISGDFRALLGNDEVTVIFDNASPTATCINDITDGEVSKVARQESLRNGMVFCCFGNERGNNSTKKTPRHNRE